MCMLGEIVLFMEFILVKIKRFFLCLFIDFLFLLIFKFRLEKCFLVIEEGFYRLDLFCLFYRNKDF